jgi:hypothetical protein
LLRVVGATVHGSERCPLLHKLSPHPVGQCLKLLFGIIATSNTRLVGDNHNGHISVCGRTAQLENPIEKLEIFDAMNIVLFDINHPISVEKE